MAHDPTQPGGPLAPQLLSFFGQILPMAGNHNGGLDPHRGPTPFPCDGSIWDGDRRPRCRALRSHLGSTAAKRCAGICKMRDTAESGKRYRSEEHTSELQSLRHLVCRLLLEKKTNLI